MPSGVDIAASSSSFSYFFELALLRIPEERPLFELLSLMGQGKTHVAEVDSRDEGHPAADQGLLRAPQPERRALRDVPGAVAVLPSCAL